MAEHEEVYDDARADRLAEMLRALAERIRQLDRSGQLLSGVPELLRLMEGVPGPLEPAEIAEIIVNAAMEASAVARRIQADA